MCLVELGAVTLGHLDRDVAQGLVVRLWPAPVTASEALHLGPHVGKCRRHIKARFLHVVVVLGVGRR